ncbi:exodeoxyribonuclease VII large subunit [Arenicella sp. 4NH20-0111]|uniref:exodeoxyribonuclease VII large subunit n=1 Tax=Arenicella sp. 4NH20-0111 TaxID=3127648 RepID=UPI00310A7B6B
MSQNSTVYQVSELTDEMRRLMETSYPEIWIEGELSSLSTPASGHLYFSLKDARSQLRCAMFKGRASINRYKPKAGDLVRVRAKISVYTARGDLQCIVQHIEEAGVGLLQKRFEELKAELHRQGLFEQKYKRPIPKFPKHIGVITSPSGAAVRDVLSALARRCPGIPVTVYPAVVQGETAAESIMSALRDASQHKQCDVLILTRGGGSLEDLWCFNHEGLARMIFDCSIPLVSGVGHEVDVTIADLVADMRAPTPTAAAELISPDTDQLFSQLKSLQFRLPNAQKRGLEQLAQNVDMLSKQLKHPKTTLRQKMDALEVTGKRLHRAAQQGLKWQHTSIETMARTLAANQPQRLIEQKQRELNQSSSRLLRANQHLRISTADKLNAIGGQLNLVSPLATLERGFSITRDKQHNIIRSQDQVKAGDQVTVQTVDATLSCSVTNIDDSTVQKVR